MVNIRRLVQSTPLFLRVVLLYVVTAISVVAVYVFIDMASPKPQPLVEQQPLPSYVRPSDGKTIISGIPSRISVPRLAVDLPVERGQYDEVTKQWSLNDEAAFFATVTSLPNDNRGNTFIYGHNNRKIFGALANIAVGDIVTIQTGNGHTFSYQYRGDDVVTPEKTSVLDTDPSSPTLTIMTCDGLWSEGRRLMYFDLVEVS